MDRNINSNAYTLFAPIVLNSTGVALTSDVDHSVVTDTISECNVKFLSVRSQCRAVVWNNLDTLLADREHVQRTVIHCTPTSTTQHTLLPNGMPLSTLFAGVSLADINAITHISPNVRADVLKYLRTNPTYVHEYFKRLRTHHYANTRNQSVESYQILQLNGHGPHTELSDIKERVWLEIDMLLPFVDVTPMKRDTLEHYQMRELFFALLDTAMIAVRNSSHAHQKFQPFFWWVLVVQRLMRVCQQLDTFTPIDVNAIVRVLIVCSGVPLRTDPVDEPHAKTLILAWIALSTIGTMPFDASMNIGQYFLCQWRQPTVDFLRSSPRLATHSMMVFDQVLVDRAVMKLNHPELQFNIQFWPLSSIINVSDSHNQLDIVNNNYISVVNIHKHHWVYVHCDDPVLLGRALELALRNYDSPRAPRNYWSQLRYEQFDGIWTDYIIPLMQYWLALYVPDERDHFWSASIEPWCVPGWPNICKSAQHANNDLVYFRNHCRLPSTYYYKTVSTWFELLCQTNIVANGQSAVVRIMRCVPVYVADVLCYINHHVDLANILAQTQ